MKKHRIKKLTTIITLALIFTLAGTTQTVLAVEDINSGITDDVSTQKQEALNDGVPIKIQVDNPDGLDVENEELIELGESEVDEDMSMMATNPVVDNNLFINGDRRPNLNIVTKNDKAYDIAKMAGQKIGGYDTVQGGCRNKTYYYFVLYNRVKEDSKIVKIRINDMKIIKVSKPLGIEHGNDITFNTKTKRIVVIHNSKNKFRVSEIGRFSLTVKKRYDVELPPSMKGFADSTVQGICGFRGISYDKENDQYVFFCKGRIIFLVTDNHFKPIKLIRPKVLKPDALQYQGMDLTKDYLFVAESSASYKYYNIIAAYDRNANYVGKILLRKGWELENIGHYGSNYYACFYTSYYTKAYKYVTVNGKKTKVSYNKLMRVNYLYKYTLKKPV